MFGELKLGCRGLGALALGGLLVLIVGCRKPAPVDPDVIARVGTREIRAADFQDWLRFHGVTEGPGRKEAALEEMIGQAALVERARAAGLDRDPELVRTWESMLVVRLREQELEARLSNSVPTDAAVRAYYDAHPAEFAEKGRRQGAVLFLEVPAKIGEEQKASIRARILEGRAKASALPPDVAIRGFGALSIDYSDDQPTRYRGGDFGWMEEGKLDGRFDPVVAKALFGLGRAGEVSEVLEGKSGFYVVRLMDLRPGRQKPFESVAAAIRHRLQFDGRKELEQAWKKSARDAVQVEIRQEALRRVPLPPRPSRQDDGPPAVQ